jgi:hypothetical protein
MAVTTPTYSFLKPVVGGDVNVWGGFLNDNSDKLDDLLDGTATVTGIDINGGSIDGTPIGAAVAAAGAFTTLSASSLVAATADINGGTADNTVIGGTTAAAGNFTSAVVGRSVYSGTANAITVTTGLSLAALTTGMEIRFRATAANTGATTINVDGLGAVSALTITGAALVATYIRTDVDTVARYNGTNWICDRQIENGSNGNGKWTRFADGTQFCEGIARTAIFDSATRLQIAENFPAAFTSAPFVSVHYNDVDAFITVTTEILNANFVTGAIASLRARSNFAYVSGNTRGLKATSVGRWI